MTLSTLPQAYEISTNIIPILIMGELRHSESEYKVNFRELVNERANL